MTGSEVSGGQGESSPVRIAKEPLWGAGTGWLWDRGLGCGPLWEDPGVGLSYGRGR